ncbi:MAG: LysR family transcriptional regulator [Flavobacterium sp.]|nr:LysR family transcriptional regulator [Flavobacterium sp.]
MHYTLHQLQLFLKIVEKKSITKAADELHLTQPAVSIQLKNFQDQFDIPLTQVLGRQLYVTEFGLEIAEIAKRIIAEVAKIDDKTFAFKGILSGKLKLSVVSTGKYVMPYFLSGFVKIFSEIDLEMDVTNKSKVIESLKSNEVDFALVSVLPTDLNISNEPLLENKLYLMRKNDCENFKTKSKKIFFEDIQLLYREEGSGTRFVMEKFFENNNIKTNIKMQLTSNESIKQAVIAGIGYSVLPIIGCRNEIANKQLQIIDVAGFPIKSEWNLIWLKNKNMSPVAQKFLQYIQSEKEAIRKAHFDWV